MRRANLLRMVAFGAIFRGADLSYSRMTGAAATGADFTDARLVRAKLNGADLQEAHFAGADSKGADFSNARLDTTVDFSNVLNLPPTLRDRAPATPGR